jgi:hypothetical protein
MPCRVSYLLSAVSAALVLTAASAAAQPGIHLTPNGFRTPIYGISVGADGTAECAALHQEQVDASQFGRQVSRAMAAISKQAVVSQEGGSSFEITYTDAEGTGFNHGATGGARRAALEKAVSVWSKVIKAEQPIKIAASMRPMDDGDNNPLTQVLMFGGPTEFWILEDKAVPSALAWQKLEGGRVENAKSADITIDVNDQVNWDYTLDGIPLGSGRSFVLAALHEMAHGLGMVNSFDIRTGKVLNDPYPFIYDLFVNRGSAVPNRLLDHAPDEKIRDMKSNDLFFNGENGNKASRESFRALPMIKLYAPDPYLAASSISHLDQSTYADERTGLMVPQIFGRGTDKIDALTISIIQDLGYTLVPPPTPTTAAPERKQ